MSEFNTTNPIVVVKSEIHGDGIIALRNYSAGDVVFCESPLLCLQSVPNRRDVLVCRYCNRFLGSVQLQLDYLSKSIDRFSDTLLQYKYKNDGSKFLSNIYPCNSNCGELYCSLYCRQKHFCKGHCLLCTGSINEENAEQHPLIQFKQHSILTNEIFLLVADMFASICCNIDQQTSKNPNTNKLEIISKALHPYENYVRNLWWDVAVLKKNKKSNKLSNTLQTLVKESWCLLAIALDLYGRGLDNILSEEYMARTIGMFEQNNVGVRLSNPITTLATQETDTNSIHLSYLLEKTKIILSHIEEETCWSEDDEDDNNNSDDDDSNDDDEEEEEEQDEEGDENEMDIDNNKQIDNNNNTNTTNEQQLKELQSLIKHETTDILYPPLDGTAFYTNICKINHSCIPNVIAIYACDEIDNINNLNENYDIDNNDDVCINYNNIENINKIKVNGLYAKLLVLKDIQIGEELLQSYIDQNLSYKMRRKALLDYGFECNCEKCKTEKNSNIPT